MSSILERRYRLLLNFYPDAYRDTHEDEIVGTLLDAADPGQINPTTREAIGLVTGGLRTRARLAAERGPAALWADGLRLSALLLLSSLLSDRILPGEDPFFAHRILPWANMGYLTVLLAVTLAVAIVAVVVGTTRICLAAVVLAGLGGWIVAPPGVVWTSPHSFGWSPTANYDVLAALVVASALFWSSLGRDRRRPWPWWLAVMAIALPVLYRLLWVNVSDWPQSTAAGFRFPVSAFLLVLPVTGLSAGSLIGNDPRPSIAAGVYSVLHLLVPISIQVELAPLGLNLWASGFPVIPMVLPLLGLAAAAIVAITESSRRLAHS